MVHSVGAAMFDDDWLIKKIKNFDLATKTNRHHIRGSFYHGGLALFVAATIYWWDIVDWSHPYTIFTVTLVIVDYIAEMFDPHPDNMGKWYERYFHRFFDEDS